MARRVQDRYTPFKVERRRLAIEDGLFRIKPTSYSGAWECVECGDTGYIGGSWMDKHIGGHIGCVECRRTRPTATFNYHLRHHARQKAREALETASTQA